MTRTLTVGAAQLGPIARDETRADVVPRLLTLLHEGAAAGCELVVFPELALTTFFPRWYTDDIAGHDHFYETDMPSDETWPKCITRNPGVQPRGRRHNLAAARHPPVGATRSRRMARSERRTSEASTST